MDYSKVANILEEFVDGRGKPWDWDDYTSAAVFDDPFLQEVQARMAALSLEYPPAVKTHYCSPEGIELIRHYIGELRAKAAACERSG